MSKRPRINNQIRASKVRLIDEKDEQHGIVSFEQAERMAAERGYDIVEVAPKANPPVCKLMDYGKFQYRQKKIDQKHKSKQQKHELKGIRLSIRTGDHDMQVKVKRAEKFLKEGHSLKVVLLFRGREVAHKDIAREKMEQFYDQVKEIAKKEAEPKYQGYTMVMILHPIHS